MDTPTCVSLVYLQKKNCFRAAIVLIGGKKRLVSATFIPWIIYVVHPPKQQLMMTAGSFCDARTLLSKYTVSLQKKTWRNSPRSKNFFFCHTRNNSSWLQWSLATSLKFLLSAVSFQKREKKLDMLKTFLDHILFCLLFWSLTSEGFGECTYWPSWISSFGKSNSLFVLEEIFEGKHSLKKCVSGEKTA